MTADATDQASIDSVVKQTKVVIACAGPYAKLGTPVVDACVRLGAHCVDITGRSHALTPISLEALAMQHSAHIIQHEAAMCQACIPCEGKPGAHWIDDTRSLADLVGSHHAQLHAHAPSHKWLFVAASHASAEALMKLQNLRFKCTDS